MDGGRVRVACLLSQFCLRRFAAGGCRRVKEPKEKDQPVEDDWLEAAKSVEVPARVKAALDDSRDFGKFREKRTFNFLHLFSGPDDKLAKALVQEGAKANLVVKVESLDIKKDPTMDLRRNNTMDEIEEKITMGNYDGYHSGFPCGSFSRVRWVQRSGMPGPVRSRSHPYGLPGNSQAQPSR